MSLNGIIDCEVLIVDEPNRLSCTWASGGEENTVTWRLQELGNGKVKLYFKQTGISNEQAPGGARGGWIGMHGGLGKLVDRSELPGRNRGCRSDSAAPCSAENQRFPHPSVRPDNFRS